MRVPSLAAALGIALTATLTAAGAQIAQAESEYTGEVYACSAVNGVERIV